MRGDWNNNEVFCWHLPDASRSRLWISRLRAKKSVEPCIPLDTVLDTVFKRFGMVRYTWSAQNCSEHFFSIPVLEAVASHSTRIVSAPVQERLVKCRMARMHLIDNLYRSVRRYSLHPTWASRSDSTETLNPNHHFQNRFSTCKHTRKTPHELLLTLKLEDSSPNSFNKFSAPQF